MMRRCRRTCQNWLRIAQAVLFCSALLACASARSAGPSNRAEGANAPSAGIQKKSGAASIQQVLHDPAGFDGQDVTLSGTFRGWSGRCVSSAVLTRSDWILEDGTGCIYVTGLIPAGLSPLEPKGEHIVVFGRVATNREGKPVVRAVRLIVLPK